MKKISILIMLIIPVCIFSEAHGFIKFKTPTPVSYFCDDTAGIKYNVYSYMNFWENDSLRNFTDYYHHERIDSDGDLYYHGGIDVSCTDGEQLYAPYDCVLLGKKVQLDKNRNLCGFGYYGWFYIPEIDVTFLIAHLNRNIQYRTGHVYQAGDPIAFGGNTGHSSAAHIHLEIIPGCDFNMSKGHRRQVRVNPEPYFFNDTPQEDLTLHYILTNLKTPSVVEEITRDISSHSFYRDTSRTTIDATTVYKPYVFHEGNPGPGKYRIETSVTSTKFVIDNAQVSQINDQNSLTVNGSTDSVTVCEDEYEFTIMDCVVAVVQKSGYVDGTSDNDVFDPNDELCNAKRGASNYEPLTNYTTENSDIIHASGVAYFTPGHSFFMNCTANDFFDYTVDTEAGKATWSFEASRSEIASRPSTKIRGYDTTKVAFDQIGLWYVETFSYGMQKTNKYYNDSTDLTFECPWCPPKPCYEDSSWREKGCQEVCDMVLRVAPILRYNFDSDNDTRDQYEVKKVCNFEVSDPSTNSYGFNYNIVGENSYSWSKNGGYSGQSSFNLLNASPGTFWYNYYTCCNDYTAPI